MEKGANKKWGASPCNIVVTGPESCGKTAVSKYLAKEFEGTWMPEFARGYIEQLKRPYTYSDVELIAKRQFDDFYRAQTIGQRLNIFDTGLIITKVWFDVVYNKHPEWLVDAITHQTVHLYLLCNTDLPWVEDAVRENGGEMREELFRKYKLELEAFNLPYKLVTGSGDERFDQAKQYVAALYKKE